MFAGRTVRDEVKMIVVPIQHPKKSIAFTDCDLRNGKFRNPRKGRRDMFLHPGRSHFQKKLIVIRGKAPRQFTLKDSIVMLQGLLPDIDVLASEIAGVIINSGEEFSSCLRQFQVHRS